LDLPNDGRLVGLPYLKEFYRSELDRERWGLLPVAQVDSYKGLLLATLALQRPERVLALVLEVLLRSPAGSQPPSVLARGYGETLYAHPERLATVPASDPAIQAKTGPRHLLRGPDPDVDLEKTMTRSRAVDARPVRHPRCRDPPEMGDFYKELIPNSHLVFVYDAGTRSALSGPEAFTEVVVDFLERHEALYHQPPRRR